MVVVRWVGGGGGGTEENNPCNTFLTKQNVSGLPENCHAHQNHDLLGVLVRAEGWVCVHVCVRVCVRACMRMCVSV